MLKKFLNFFKKQNNFRYIAFGFIAVIFLGSGLLMIPGVAREGYNLNYIDALFTSASAVCVTGLIVVDVGSNFSIYGQVIIMLLIQIGGLGVTTLGAGLISAIRRRTSLKERNVIKESLNMEDAKSLFAIFKRVFLYTFIIEFFGALFSLITFAQHLEISDAIFKSVFHSIASFNNAGFDIMGGGTNFTIAPYNTDVLFNIVTCLLIILGGIGFLVLSDLLKYKFNLKKITLQSKVVLLMTSTLIVVGTLLLALTERNAIANGSFSWLGAFFTSVSSRTAGFSTYNLANFTKSGQLVVIMLMAVGASPGSTGGGIKTTTLFVLVIGVYSLVRNRSSHAFKYSISREAVRKAMVVSFLAILVILGGTLIMSLIESGKLLETGKFHFIDVLFEVTSAYGTVGLSTGITTYLSIGSKILLIMIMYLGRVGPLTFISLWNNTKEEYYQYAEGIIPIG